VNSRRRLGPVRKGPRYALSSSVGPIGDLDLGVFAVTEIATKYTTPVSHLVPSMPNAVDARVRRDRARA
jgi:hypothetical protein